MTRQVDNHIGAVVDIARQVDIYNQNQFIDFIKEIYLTIFFGFLKKGIGCL